MVQSLAHKHWLLCNLTHLLIADRLCHLKSVLHQIQWWFITKNVGRGRLPKVWKLLQIVCWLHLHSCILFLFNSQLWLGCGLYEIYCYLICFLLRRFFIICVWKIQDIVGHKNPLFLFLLSSSKLICIPVCIAVFTEWIKVDPSWYSYYLSCWFAQRRNFWWFFSNKFIYVW